jgi:predicted DNA-binding transcriptional regulator AlpA
VDTFSRRWIGKAGLRNKLGGASNSTIDRLEDAGVIPPRRRLTPGGHALWDEAEVDASIDSHLRASPEADEASPLVLKRLQNLRQNNTTTPAIDKRKQSPRPRAAQSSNRRDRPTPNKNEKRRVTSYSAASVNPHKKSLRRAGKKIWEPVRP